MLNFHEKYFPYTVKKINKKDGDYLIRVTVYNKGWSDNKPIMKVLIKREEMEKMYPGYTSPSNLYALDMEENNITLSPCKVGYVGTDTIFQITEEGDEVMMLRLFKQWEWDLLSNKKYLKSATSISNVKFFKDIQNLFYNKY